MGRFNYQATDMKTALAALEAMGPWASVALYTLDVTGRDPEQKRSDELVMLGLLVPRNVSKTYNEISPLGREVLKMLPRWPGR